MRPSLLGLLACALVVSGISARAIEPRGAHKPHALQDARRKAMLDRLHNTHVEHHAKPKPAAAVSPPNQVLAAAAADAAAPGADCAKPPPQPSGGLSQPGRRSLDKTYCPGGFVACPVENKDGFECVDTSSNLSQCGACYAHGGKDCSSQEGVDAVGCIAGRCEVWSCQKGFQPNRRGTACEWVGLVPPSQRA